jgi:hypothetical protein
MQTSKLCNVPLLWQITRISINLETNCMRTAEPLLNHAVRGISLPGPGHGNNQIGCVDTFSHFPLLEESPFVLPAPVSPPPVVVPPVFDSSIEKKNRDSKNLMKGILSKKAISPAVDLFAIIPTGRETCFGELSRVRT